MPRRKPFRPDDVQGARVYTGRTIGSDEAVVLAGVDGEGVVPIDTDGEPLPEGQEPALPIRRHRPFTGTVPASLRKDASSPKP